MPTKLELAVNHAISERQQYLQRMKLAGTAGIDAKRPSAWSEYGYKDVLFFRDFFNLYERHGVAHGAVQRLVEKCWESTPWIIEGDEYENRRPETPWEIQVRLLFKRLRAWRQVQDADRRRLIGRYSGLLLQVADGLRWDQEMGAGELLRMIPAWEGQLEPSAWDENDASPTYGEVTAWSYQEAAVREGEHSGPGRTVQVHPSRVVIFGDPREGIPFLQAGYNDFVNLEKILGGSGESFLKNAARQMHIGFEKDVDLAALASAYGVPLADLQTIFNDTARDLNIGQDVVAITQGATMTPLVATVPDPEEHFDIALQSAAASVRIPAKILVGMQTGERASTEDLRDFNKRGQGRRVSELSCNLEQLVSHMIRYKLIPPPPAGEFSICWSDLTEASQEEKLANAFKMADINAKQAATGAPVFTDDEIREAAGWDPRGDDTPLPDSEDSDLEEDE